MFDRFHPKSPVGKPSAQRASVCLRVALTISMLLIGSSAVAVQADGNQNVFDAREQTFVLGLKQRRLYGIAEKACLQLLQRDNITPTDQAGLTVELIQIRMLRATEADEKGEDEAWQAVWQTEIDFQNRYPQHPRQLLVAVQTGLAHLQRAQRITGAIEAQIIPPQLLAQSREQLLQETRKAKRIFTDVERKIERMLPEQRSKSLTVDELTPPELLILKSNVRFQIAICQLETVAAYETDDAPSRISAMNDVLKRLQEVQDSVIPSQRIWWLSRIAQLKCYRMMGQSDRAQQMLATLPKEPAPADLLPRLMEQRLRLAIAVADTAALNSALQNDLISQTPELEIVKIEAAVTLAKRVRAPEEQARWLAFATQKKQNVETQFGSYWGRRAALALIDASGVVPVQSPSGTGGTNAVSNNSAVGASIEILVQTARQSQRQGNLADAIKAYDSAIAQVDEGDESSAETVLGLQIAASQIFEGQSNFTEAARRLISVAQNYSQNPTAAQVHLRGIWNLAKANKANATQSEKAPLVAALKSHLTTWPSSPTKNQAALWLMSEQILKQETDEALKSFEQIATQSDSFSAALKQVRAMFVRAQRADGKTPEEQAAAENNAERLGKQIFNQLQRRYQSLGSIDGLEPKQLGKLQAALLSHAIEIGLRSGGVSKRALSQWTDDFRREKNGTDLKEFANAMRWSSLLLIVDRGARQPPAVLSDATAMLELGAPNKQECQRLFSAIAIIEPRLEESGDSAGLSILREFGLEVVTIARRQPLTISQSDRWKFQLGRLRRLTGDMIEAVSILEPLSQRFQSDALIQLEYARALSEIEDRNDDALAVWRRLTRVLSPRSENWYEAKLGVGQSLQKSGQVEEARKLLRYLKSVYGWNDSAWADDLDRMLRSL